MKKVTIIIPTYNQAHIISQAIQSAVDQDYKDLEVIVADDCSTDQTEQVVNKFLKNPKVKYCRTPQNLGRVGNYHYSLYDLATGDYFCVLDGDDYFTDKSFISKAVRIFEKDEAVKLVFAKVKVYFEEDRSTFPLEMKKRKTQIISGKEVFLKFDKFFVPHLATVVKRSAAIESGYYLLDIISSDWESLLRLLPKIKVGFLDEFVGVWRKHETNASRSPKFSKIEKNLLYINNPFDTLKKNDYFTKQSLLVWKRKMLKNYFLRLVLAAILKHDKKEIPVIFDLAKKTDSRVYNSLIFDWRLWAIRAISSSNLLLFLVLKYILKAEFYYKDIISSR